MEHVRDSIAERQSHQDHWPFRFVDELSVKLLVLIAVLFLGAASVEARSYSLTPTSLAFNAGGAPSCDYTIDTGDSRHSASDWIGFYIVGSPNEAFIARQLIGSAPSGRVVLNEVNTFYFPEVYEFRLFKGKGFSHLACTSKSVKVTPPASLPRNPNQILIVYNSDDPDSTEVAGYYQTSRNVPVANMLGLRLGRARGIEDIVDWSVVVRTILPALRAKLTALEASHPVYYIQLVYRMPYLVEGAPALVDSFAELGVHSGLKSGQCLCSHLQDPYFDAESAYRTGKPTQTLSDNPMRALRHE